MKFAPEKHRARRCFNFRLIETVTTVYGQSRTQYVQSLAIMHRILYCSTYLASLYCSTVLQHILVPYCTLSKVHVKIVSYRDWDHKFHSTKLKMTMLPPPLAPPPTFRRQPQHAILYRGLYRYTTLIYSHPMSGTAARGLPFRLFEIGLVYKIRAVSMIEA